MKREKHLTGQNLVSRGKAMIQGTLEVSRIKSQKIKISQDTILLLVIACANYSWKQFAVGSLGCKL